jgi:hypothetical protein
MHDHSMGVCVDLDWPDRVSGGNEDSNNSPSFTWEYHWRAHCYICWPSGRLLVHFGCSKRALIGTATAANSAFEDTHIHTPCQAILSSLFGVSQEFVITHESVVECVWLSICVPTWWFWLASSTAARTIIVLPLPLLLLSVSLKVSHPLQGSIHTVIQHTHACTYSHEGCVGFRTSQAESVEGMRTQNNSPSFTWDNHWR